jgi:hypothetical protein
MSLRSAFEQFPELSLQDPNFSFSDEAGMYDDTSSPASALRFSVGNMVIYKSELTNGWTKGEVVKVNQRLKLNNHQGIYIAYLLWPHREMPDEELGTEYAYEDSDNFIRPILQNSKPASSLPTIPIITFTAILIGSIKKPRRAQRWQIFSGG